MRITNQATGAVRRMQTDSSGNFNFALLPIGVYSVKVEKTGFRTLIQNEITLQVGENRTLPIAMQLGDVTQEVTVTGAPGGVNLVDATVKEVVDQTRMVDLPLNGRSPPRSATNHARHGGRHHRRGPWPITERWANCKWQPASL